nr:MAG TPA: hypothetical protein [Caudoviricetes sp.]
MQAPERIYLSKLMQGWMTPHHLQPYKPSRTKCYM